MKIKTVTYNDKKLRIYNDELIHLPDLIELINCERSTGSKLTERHNEIKTILIKNVDLNEDDMKISNRGAYFVNEKSAKFIIYKTTNTTIEEKNQIMNFLIKNLDEFKFEGCEVAKLLGYKTLNNSTLAKNIPSNMKKIKKTKTSGGLQNKIFFNKEAVFILISKSQKLTELQKAEAMKEMFDEDVIVVHSRKEIEFLDKLKKQLAVFNIIEFSTQHNVNGKKIDLYLPQINVAIEYDENGHAGYSHENHEGREQMIKAELNCQFIRVSDAQDDQTNCAIVLKELMKMSKI